MATIGAKCSRKSGRMTTTIVIVNIMVNRIRIDLNKQRVMQMSRIVSHSVENHPGTHGPPINVLTAGAMTHLPEQCGTSKCSNKIWQTSARSEETHAMQRSSRMHKTRSETTRAKIYSVNDEPEATAHAPLRYFLLFESQTPTKNTNENLLGCSA